MSNDTTGPGHGPGRKRTKENFWRGTLLDFAASRQSVREFCRTRQLSEPSFYAWRRTVAQRDADRSKAARPAVRAPAFLPIKLADAGTAWGDMPIEIVLACGHRIRLRPPVNRTALAEIVVTLQSTCIAVKPAEAWPSAGEA